MMKVQTFCRPCRIGVLLICLITGLFADPSRVAAQQQYFVQSLAEKRLKELPLGPLYWRVENFADIADAQAAQGPASLAVELIGKVWLFTLGPKGGVTVGGTNTVEIGPVPPISAPEYLLRINYVGGPPGAKTAIHTHPGSESFYVLTGQLGQRRPDDVVHIDAGQSMAGHGLGMPMEVSSSGSSDLTALVMFVVDATKQFSSPAKLE